MAIPVGTDTPFNSLQKAIAQNDGSNIDYVVQTKDLGANAVADGTYGAITVTSTPILAAVSGTNKDPRKFLVVCPISTIIYWGFTNAVTTSTGIPIPADSIGKFKVNEDVSIWLVSGGSVNTRIAEF